MRPSSLVCGAVLASLLPHSPRAQEPGPIPGERIPADAVSPLVLESMDDVVARDRAMVRDPVVHGVWNGEDGVWFVPNIGGRLEAHSGEKAVINKWGDPKIGVGFGRSVDVHGAWLAGHGAAPAPRVVVVGFRDGVEIARTEPIALDPATSHRAALGFDGVDRIEFRADPAAGAMGFFALDDLAFAAPGAPETVLDFEDVPWRTVLTGTNYAGISWETGTGLREVQRDGTREVHAPKGPSKAGAPVEEPTAPSTVSTVTAPAITQSFVGPRLGDAGGGWIPPDTCGTVGPDHFVSVVNANLSIWRKVDGRRLLNVGLDAFFGATVGDPRAVWDSHDQQFVVLATDFSRSNSIYVGVSQTADPTGSWFKFSFRSDQGTDAGRWPDYPTLGVDARGIYSAAYMVGSTARMTVWAIDKSPLRLPTPTAPTISAFRSLAWEGAIQPCVTFGDPGAEYLVSRSASTRLRLRRITWAGGGPSLFEHGSVVVPRNSSPPDAPALGSTTPISTLDTRPMNAVFRNGSVWTIHGVSSGGRAAVRWYEIAVATSATVQVGTIADPVWSYYFGTIAVDAHGDVAIGLSGSHANVHPTAMVTGRLQGDPAGLTGTPVEVHAGEGAYERLDGNGTNRFGDYSSTSVDPVDDTGFWLIQEYARSGNTWGTWIARVAYEAFTYGDGLAGTNGVPALVALDRPVLGATMNLQLDHSSGPQTTPGILVIGVLTTAQPLLDGTLLVQPVIAADVAVTFPSTQVPIAVPNAPTMIGGSVFFQALQLDAGASHGVSFTPGLEVRPASR